MGADGEAESQQLVRGLVITSYKRSISNNARIRGLILEAIGYYSVMCIMRNYLEVRRELSIYSESVPAHYMEY
jgi:hypothetical protein